MVALHVRGGAGAVGRPRATSAVTGVDSLLMVIHATGEGYPVAGSDDQLIAAAARLNDAYEPVPSSGSRWPTPSRARPAPPEMPTPGRAATSCTSRVLDRDALSRAAENWLDLFGSSADRGVRQRSRVIHCVTLKRLNESGLRETGRDTGIEYGRQFDLVAHRHVAGIQNASDE